MYPCMYTHMCVSYIPVPFISGTVFLFACTMMVHSGEAQLLRRCVFVFVCLFVCFVVCVCVCVSCVCHNKLCASSLWLRCQCIQKCCLDTSDNAFASSVILILYLFRISCLDTHMSYLTFCVQTSSHEHLPASRQMHANHRPNRNLFVSMFSVQKSHATARMGERNDQGSLDL
jgi:hypothetical protein